MFLFCQVIVKPYLKPKCYATVRTYSMSAHIEALPDVRSNRQPSLYLQGRPLGEIARPEVPTYAEAYSRVIPEICETVDRLSVVQNKLTGAFPATYPEFTQTGNDMSDSWTRDTSEDTRGLIFILNNLPLDPDTHNKALDMTQRAINGQLRLYGSEPWISAFQQPMRVQYDPQGEPYTVLTQPAPPVKFDKYGRPTPHWEHDQPDSWGFFHTMIADAYDGGIVDQFSDEQLRTIAATADYNVNRAVHIGEFSSMWENAPGRNPAALSTVAVVASGLRDIQPLVKDFRFDGILLGDKIDFMQEEAERFLATTFPRDYTNFQGHESEVDLATLIAMNADREFTLPYARYSRISTPVLGDARFPGVKRYIGDGYSGLASEPMEGEERPWAFGKALRANMTFRLSEQARREGRLPVAKNYRAVGMKYRDQAMQIKNAVGFHSELLIPEGNGMYRANRALPWGEVKMAEANVRYVNSCKWEEAS